MEAPMLYLLGSPWRVVVASVSGSGGATVRILDVSTGHLLHERHLHKAEAGRLLEPDNTGVALAFDSDSHLYALTNGHTIRKVDVSTGEILWGWAAPDQTYVTST